MKKQFKISKEIKEQILKRIKEEGVSVSKAAEEHGLHTSTIYAWLSKGIKAQPSYKEYFKLQKEKKELLALVGELTIKLSQTQKKI
jgi:transposase-like protein